ncbi:MAG: toprim domain-containing protein, partial [Candidatus Peribacteraceae bacterium]|nr:toprim domain-containing protein [Candidatus Peribacteraceae bacterium]
RSTKKVILVEGYFDVLACHRLGIKNTIAVSGTALTEQHVKTLKRYADTVVLCLDQDRAGQQAAERSFLLCSEVELPVHAITLEQKDPD